MKYFVLSEQTLRELQTIVGEVPTKFGMLMGNLLDRGLREYHPPEPPDAAPEQPAKSE